MRTQPNMITGRVSSTGALTNASADGVSVVNVATGQYRLRFPPWFRLRALAATTDSGGSYFTVTAGITDRDAVISQYASTTGTLSWGGHVYFIASGDVRT